MTIKCPPARPQATCANSFITYTSIKVQRLYSVVRKTDVCHFVDRVVLSTGFRGPEMKVPIANESSFTAERSGRERPGRTGVRVAIHRLQAIFLLLVVCAVVQPSRAQTAKPPQTQPASSPAPSPSPSPERSVSWVKLGPNILRDQKEIWLFPVSVARGHHLK